jgi:hypothetical protein
MSTLLGLGGSNSKAVVKYTGLQVQTSALNLAIAIGWGRNRLAPNLIWWNDFKAHQQKVGKGGGKGGKSYTYTVAVLMALGEGVISAVNKVYLNQSQTTLAKLGLTLYTGTTVQTPFPYIVTAHPTEALSYARTAYLATSSYDLGSSPALPQHSMECDFPLCNSMPGTPDANFGDIIPDFLTNTQYGMGFTSGDIDATDLAFFKSYQQAQGLFFSPVLNQQEAANSIIDRWALLANSWIFWSGDRLRLVPLGDEALSAHSATYTPNLTIQYDLTVANAFLDKDNPITVSRKDPADAYNRTVLQITDRALDYNSNPIEYKDQTLVDLYGLRDNSNNSSSEICDAAVGLTAATLIGQRAAYLRNGYKWRTNYRYVRLEPGDLVSITDPNNAAIQKLVVRITKVDEDADFNLSFQAEEFPGTIGQIGNGTAPTGSPTSFNQMVDPGDVNPPCIFEPDSSLTNGHAQVWIAASGGQFWGSADVFISFNGGSTYSPIGAITGKARQGVLTSILASHADPDTVNTLAIDLTVSAGVLDPVTHSDADAFRTLCLVAPTASSNGELVAYGTVASTGTYTDNLTYLRRGLYSSTIGAHAIGAQFTLLDLTGQEGSLLQYDLPAEYIGTTIHVKFVSKNIYGLAQQDISMVTDYTYVPLGTGYGGGTGGVPVQPTGLTSASGAQFVSLFWNANPSTDNVIAYDIYAAVGTSVPFGSTALIASVNALTYNVAGLLSNTGYTFYIKARNAVGSSVPSAARNATTINATLVVGGASFYCQTIQTKPVAAVIGQFSSPYAWTLPSLAHGAVAAGQVDVAPGADTDFLIKKGGATIATVRWASGSTSATLIDAADVSFAIDDELVLVSPASYNGMTGVLSLSILGTRP